MCRISGIPCWGNHYSALPKESSFHAWNLLRRHGEIDTKWIDTVVRRMESWGLNTIGNWSDPRLWDAHKKAYQVNLRGWGMETGYMGMPDVYSEGFPKMVGKAADFPAFIGTSLFQWMDQPATGRMDGKNYNIGLVDVTDRPYREMIEAMKATHRQLQSVHAGKTPPFDAKPRAQ